MTKRQFLFDPRESTLGMDVDRIMARSLLDLALSYCSGGISLVPCSHHDKRPVASMLPDGQWKSFQTTPPSDEMVRQWFDAGCQSVAGIGGAVSKGLVVIDFDEARFFDEWKALVGNLADSLCIQRTGRDGGGFQVWLRCPDPGHSAKLAFTPDDSQDTGRKCAIETKAEGGYAIMPGSLHPSGRLYETIQGDFANVPTVSQSLADALLAAARKMDEAPLTIQQMEAREHSAKQWTSTDGEGSVINAFNQQRKIEDVLLAEGYIQFGNRWKRPGGKTLSITVKEGRSFHHSSNDPLCDGYWHRAFDVFCQLKHGGDCNAAVAAVADRVLPKPQADISGILKQGEVELEVEDIELNADIPDDPNAFPPDCLRPPGLISDIIDYNLAASMWPQPELALAGAIALVSTITGRKIRDMNGTRTNAYVLGLANSGSGKENARKINKRILVLCKQEKMAGPEGIESSAGLTAWVVEQNPILFQVDEIAQMLETMKDPRKAPHMYKVGGVLNKLESCADTFYRGGAYANVKQTVYINQPHACLYGTAPARTFWGSLTAENVSEGLLGRMFVFEASKRYVDYTAPLIVDPPQHVLDKVRWWLKLPGGNLENINPCPREARYTPEAESRFIEHVTGIALRRQFEDDVTAALWSRTTGKTAKLALILACSRETGEEEILVRLEDVDRSIKINNWLTRRMLFQVFQHVAQSDRERKMKDIVRLLDKQMTKSQLVKKTPGLNRRERNELVDELLESGLVQAKEIKTKTKSIQMLSRARKPPK